jgi:hypothetical protein
LNAFGAEVVTTSGWNKGLVFLVADGALWVKRRRSDDGERLSDGLSNNTFFSFFNFSIKLILKHFNHHIKLDN